MGDSPILGAGLYVDGEVGAAGSTGRGEANLYNLSSFLIVENMRRGMHPKDAGMDALRRVKANTVEKRLLNGEGQAEVQREVLHRRQARAATRASACTRARTAADQKFAVCTEKGPQTLPLEGLLGEADDAGVSDDRDHASTTIRADARRGSRGLVVDDARAGVGATTLLAARRGAGTRVRAEGGAVPAHRHVQAARRADGDAAISTPDALAAASPRSAPATTRWPWRTRRGVLGTTAKVVMPKTANPFRVGRCRELGAEVELVDDVHTAFDRVQARSSETEGRTFVHPFEGPRTALGTATLGLELVGAGAGPRRGHRADRRRRACAPASRRR